jgi:DKNYY family protein
METFRSTIIIILFAVFSSCNNSSRTGNEISKTDTVFVYAKEPNDSADYKLLKYNFYLSKSGQLCERKLVSAKGTNCNCLFEVYYDSLFKIYNDDTLIEKHLNTIVDINSFVWLDSTEYSKDKNKVFYFHGNSDGGNRVIVDKADPLTFKRLCEYRWGIDKNHVFYKGDIVQGINLKYLQVLYPPDTSYHFIDYIKDDKNIFYENEIVKGADAKTFKVVSGQKWEAEDKNYKYASGRRKE